MNHGSYDDDGDFDGDFKKFLSHSDLFQGLHSFMKDSAGSAFNPFGKVAEKTSELDCDQFLARLSRRLTNETTAALTSKQEKEALENRPKRGHEGVPAGYTYLLQLVAHDVVNTSIASPAGAKFQRQVRNLRSIGLELETLFGGGPSACPFAFDPAKKGKARVRLKTETGKDTSVGRDLKRIYEASGEGEVCVADPRNEDTIILAQLTALFHEFHNLILAAIQSEREYEDKKMNVLDSRRDDGARARAVTAYAFRQIVKHDLLVRILDPDVFDHYAKSTKSGNFFDSPRTDGSISLEFAHGAARVAHAMVQEGYFFNNHESVGKRHWSLERVSKKKTVKMPSNRGFPLPPTWRIDWSLFFACEKSQTASDEFNWARKFCVRFPRFFSNEEAFPAPTGSKNTDGEFRFGLLYRDLARHASSGIWSVSNLMQVMKKLSGKERISSKILEKHHQDTLEALKNKTPKTVGNDPIVNALAADPPLQIYVAYEAEIAHDGARLGPLGSILFAEALMPALNRSAGIYDKQKIYGQHIEAIEDDAELWSKKIFKEMKFRGSRGRPSCPISMPELLKFLARKAPDALMVTEHPTDAARAIQHFIND